jgi:hypothetical protein
VYLHLDAEPSVPIPSSVARHGGTELPVSAAFDVQTRALRAMTADEKVRVSQALWEETWEVLAAGVRGRHPDWTPTQVVARVRELLRDVRA